MRSFLLKLFAFTIICFVAYSITITTIYQYAPDFLKKNLKFKRGANGHMFTRLREADTSSNIDVLIMGSSHAYRGFDTRIFKDHNLRAFNFGSSSQSPLQTRYLLNKYVDKLKPKVVVWEVFPNSFTSNGVESFIDVVSNEKNPFGLWKMAIEINRVETYNAYIIACVQALCGMGRDFREKRVSGKDTYIAGGYVQRVMEVNHVKVKKRPANKVFAEDQVEAFEETIAALKQKNIEVYVVQAPYTRAFAENITNAAAIDDYFNSLVATNQVDFYMNFNTPELALDDSLHYYDAHHLNQEGIEKFNKFFLKEYTQVRKGVYTENESQQRTLPVNSR